MLGVFLVITHCRLGFSQLDFCMVTEMHLEEKLTNLTARLGTTNELDCKQSVKNEFYSGVCVYCRGVGPLALQRGAAKGGEVLTIPKEMAEEDYDCLTVCSGGEAGGATSRETENL